MGRTPSGRAPIQQISLIRGKHLEIIRRLIAGESQRRIAVELGMSEGRLSVVCNSPLFKRKYAEMQADVRSRFVEKTASIATEVDKLQTKAVGVLKNMLENPTVDGMKVSLPLKRDVALDILDLGGNGKKLRDGKSSAMEDVVKIISEGFALAKSAMEERKRRDEVVDPGFIDVTNVAGEITDDPDVVETSPENLDVQGLQQEQEQEQEQEAV